VPNRALAVSDSAPANKEFALAVSDSGNDRSVLAGKAEPNRALSDSEPGNKEFEPGNKALAEASDSDCAGKRGPEKEESVGSEPNKVEAVPEPEGSASFRPSSEAKISTESAIGPPKRPAESSAIRKNGW
jgi:hypothetical protein